VKSFDPTAIVPRLSWFAADGAQAARNKAPIRKENVKNFIPFFVFIKHLLSVYFFIF
jgi:hypothetical protein